MNVFSMVKAAKLSGVNSAKFTDLHTAKFSADNAGQICCLNSGLRREESRKAVGKSGVRVNIKVVPRLRCAEALSAFPRCRTGSLDPV